MSDKLETAVPAMIWQGHKKRKRSTKKYLNKMQKKEIWTCEYSIYTYIYITLQI